MLYEIYLYISFFAQKISILKKNSSKAF